MTSGVFCGRLRRSLDVQAFEATSSEVKLHYAMAFLNCSRAGPEDPHVSVVYECLRLVFAPPNERVSLDRNNESYKEIIPIYVNC
jgi:hypothetical protein